MSFLKKLTRGLMSAEVPTPKGKDGARAYGVGDIHGRLDLLDAMIEKIERDVRGRASKRTFIIFLGDYIDRGPASANVIERLRTFNPDYATPVFLSGNHEEVLLRILGGEHRLIAGWLKFGGAECAASYGLDPAALRRVDEKAAAELLRHRIPPSHVAFLESLGDTFSFGDYLFVHAGIRPGIALDEQSCQDMRWIREPFLTDVKEHGFMVVHGHTIVEEAEERTNRIAIDTGAYRSGVLTALGIENKERWYLATERATEPSAWQSAA